MALASILGLIEFPYWPFGLKLVFTSPGEQSVTNSSDQVAWIVQVLEGGTIDAVHFRLGSSSTQTLRVAFQNLTSGEFPDGTDTHFRTLATVGGDANSYVSTGLMTTDGTDVGNKKVVAAGDSFAVVVSNPGHTSGNVGFSYLPREASEIMRNTFLRDAGGGGWTTSDLVFGTSMMALEYNDASFPYMENTVIAETITNHTLDDADTPDEYALRIQVPVDMRAHGVIIKGATTNGVTAVVYDESDTILGGGAMTPSWIDSGSRQRVRHYYFATPVSLTKNTTYRIAWKPPASPTNSEVMSMSVPSAAIRKAMHNGLNLQRSVRTNSGAWTDSDTNYILAAFLVDQLDDGAGGGGGGGICDFGGLINGTRITPLAGA